MGRQAAVATYLVLLYLAIVRGVIFQTAQSRVSASFVARVLLYRLELASTDLQSTRTRLRWWYILRTQNSAGRGLLTLLSRSHSYSLGPGTAQQSEALIAAVLALGWTHLKYIQGLIFGLAAAMDQVDVVPCKLSCQSLESKNSSSVL